MQTLGVAGTALYGGYIESREKSPELASHDARYRTYSDILANTAIVAAGVRYYVNLVGGAEWSFAPVEVETKAMKGEARRHAELAEAMLTEDPERTWPRIVRRAAMHPFYGFSIQEWTAGRRPDGLITIRDIAPRAQVTIEKWDTDNKGVVHGVWQTSPQTYQDIYLPRAKLLYIVDDSLDDSPEGYGLFRQMVAPAKRLARYEQLEGFGHETDLRGIPIARGPLTELAEKVQSGDITEADRKRLEKPLADFVKEHVRNPELGMLLDSEVYRGTDDTERPSTTRMWDVELLQGSSTSFAENAAAIERLNREIARIIGVDQLLLGSDSQGSFALSKDKTHAFYLMVTGALVEIRKAVQKDVLAAIWRLNGWPVEMMPQIKTEAVGYTDVEQAAGALRDLATAGAPLFPEDPAYGEMLDLLGLTRPDEAALARRKASEAADDDTDPDDDADVDPEDDDE
ncbi:MAG: hypothetical protein OXG79_12550 [Chloroflexi bacterium]|nr:hypothetical protein [Chloroflexota bacterium]